MRRSGFPIWLLVISLLVLTSCELQRSDDSAGDIAQPVPSVVITQAQEGFTPPEGGAAQTGNAIIRLQPNAQQIEVGAILPVEVRLANVTNLVGADVELRFNPAVLQVQDADPNAAGIQVQPGDFLAANFVVMNSADNTTGIIRYALTQLAPTPPVSGEGRLFLVTFQGVAQGVSDLTFSTVQLANSEFQEIPTTPENGQITVGQGGAIPTASPTPPIIAETLTPTPLLPTPTTIPGATDTPIPTVQPPTPVPTDVLPPTPTLVPTVPPPPTATPPMANLPYDLPPGGTLGFCYRVQPGENMLTVSNKFGVPPQNINIVNDLYPPGHTYIHQVLFSPTIMGHGPNFYQIQPGDTLTSIADQCRLTPKVIAKANGIDENDLIGAGQILLLPIPPYPPPSRYPYPLPIVPLCCPPPGPYR